MVKRISIIVCCYNSSARIEQTLQYAFKLKTAHDLQYEILVVDNNSTDQTSAISQEAARKYNVNAVPFKVVYESKPGLSYARKCGVREASSDILLFCDDDNHLDENYLVNAFEILEANKNIAILGGWCRPKLTINPGSWIVDFYPALAIDESPKPDGDKPWIFGAGMIIRKSIYDDLRKINIELKLSDRVGTKQTSGGDCELCMMTKFLGHRVFYSSRLMLDHQVSESRLRKISFIKGNFRNVFPVIYLFLLPVIMEDKRIDADKLFYGYVKLHFKQLLHFLPRMVLGNHRFYSFIAFYQSLQILIWMFINKKAFNEMVSGIIKNLYRR